ncbi:MAG: DNA translocase FtsK [Lawsonibacter sp.]|jgi:S-DNA-T family DNA segregation ATPase FtsK/SpoIIIE|nr:DNA translocase FtsK [Lawsonibacter sp.]
MATQKKTGGSRSASGGRRTASSSKSKGGSRKQTAQPYRREMGAVACLLLAIFSLFGCFDIKAIFISFFCDLLKGMMGYGFWLVPPALLLGAFILGLHRGRPVRLRLACALLLPLLLSCLLHSVLAQPMEWNAELWGALVKSGMEMKSGGALGGIAAQCFIALFSRMGAAIVFVLLGLLAGLAAFNRTVFDIVQWVLDRPRYEYEPEPEPAPRRERRRERREEPAPQPRNSSRSAIDIPVDDGPLTDRAPSPPPERKKKGFFDRSARVPAPDQLLSPREEPRSVEELEEKAAPEPPSRHDSDFPSISKPEPITQPGQGQAAPVEAEPVRQPDLPAAVRPYSPPEEPSAPPVPPTPVPPPAPAPQPEMGKVTAKDAAAQAAEVGEEIQQAMGLETAPYQYPPLSLLNEGAGEVGGQALSELNANRQRLTDTIHSFGIDADIINVVRGPSVTRYELELDQGVRLNKLTNLSDDIALALGATGVRIAPIPDKISVVGIEVPNKVVSPVSIHSVIGAKAFTDGKSKTSFAVGKDISGQAIVGDINKLPHLLIAGTTGSGKSVCTNSLIISLLYKATPEEVRLIMVDPKMVELGIYNGIPHLLIPVVTDPKKAAGALQWAVTEMMKRYRTFSEVGVRKLEEYNALAARTEGMEKMPFIVVVIDELADLMLVAAKEVEESICRVAQMGRAAGMHLVIATQRPSADVITGLMKANIPSRIAFAVASAMESRIILDTQGAEKLVGRGDMLFAPLGSGKPQRVQGCFISDPEVAAVVGFVKKNSGAAQYDNSVMEQIEHNAAEKDKGSKGVGGSAPEDVDGGYDELIDAAAEVVVETGQASVSMLQRRLKLGYARAARLVDQLEEKGIVGPFEGAKPRQLLVTKEQWQEMKYRQGTATPEPAGVSAPPAPVQSPAGDAPPFDVEDALDRAEEDTL